MIIENPIKDGEVRLRVHGLKKLANHVRASAFAHQLAALVETLRMADRFVNGRVRFEYVVSDLRPGSAEATLAKVQTSRKPVDGDPLRVFGEVMEGVSNEDSPVIFAHRIMIPSLERIVSGAGRSFSHSDLEVSGYKPFRIDQFMATQIHRLEHAAVNDLTSYFRGVATGSFDGTVEAVDIRGTNPLVKLILAAGRREIDCICRGMDNDELGKVLGKRVWIEGRAHYDGSSGLPARIEIINMQPIKESPDFSQWRGRFKGLVPQEIEA
jgi:hypothetical protein